MAHDGLAKGRAQLVNRVGTQRLSGRIIKSCQHSHESLMLGPVRVLTEKHINVGFGKSSSGCLVGEMAYNQFTTWSPPQEPPVTVRAEIQLTYLLRLSHPQSPSDSSV